MKALNSDAYTPEKIASRVEQESIIKTNLDPTSTFVLALLGGAFIALGSIFFTIIIHDADFYIGVTRLIGGVVFCLGFILVVVAGAELFTNNNLIVMAYVSKKITLYRLLRNWFIVFTGNFFGALVMVLLVYLSGHWLDNYALIGLKAISIANEKVNLSFMQAMTLGILCNILVCLAIWLCYSCHSVTDKILAIIFPVSAFVALGFEHSVANMYLIPAGISAMQVPEVMSQHEVILKILEKDVDLSNLTITNFLLKNLLPVTIGNIIGGSFFVGITYWFIYLRKFNFINENNK